jgi:hypothetical protein
VNETSTNDPTNVPVVVVDDHDVLLVEVAGFPSNEANHLDVSVL